MAVRLLLLVFAIGCGPSAPPSATPRGPGQPATLPPLPPSNSTSVALLVRHARDIGLSPGQVSQLEQLEVELTDQNEPLAAKLATLENPGSARRAYYREQDARAKKRREAGLPPGQTKPRGDPAAEQRKARAEFLVRRARAAAIVRAKIERNKRTMLNRAMRLLSPEQRSRAAGLLVEHGHGVKPDATKPPVL